MKPENSTFYGDLNGFTDFLDFTRSEYYQELPDDWWVVITDIQDSTQAILEGRYKDVNSLGVASIVGILNAVKPLKVPFTFGGDGARLCIPDSFKPVVESALIATQQMARKSFDLNLRVGMVSVKTVLTAGTHILVGKYHPNPSYSQAMFLGDGMGYAESLVKNPEAGNPYILKESSLEPSVSFEGFECRWNEVPSPHEEVITLLVQALETAGTKSSRLYREVINSIDKIYGKVDSYHPIRQELLSMTSSLKKLSSEIKIRSAFKSPWSALMNSIRVLAAVFSGSWLIALKTQTERTDWGNYKQRLIMNTDFRKVDEAIKMVISGTALQRIELRSVLDRLYKEKKIAFGIHSSSTALLTCVVSNYGTDHIHFLDGSNGGYALAAIELKRQLKALNHQASL